MTVDQRIRRYRMPTRILWQSQGEGSPTNAECLLRNRDGQAFVFGPQTGCMMKRAKGGEPPAILVDFGEEIHGGVQIVSGFHSANPATGRELIKARLRFGESASEAMGTPNNGHAPHDFEISLPWSGLAEYGQTGFRFVRIDLLTEDAALELVELRAVELIRDLPWRGRFECNDARLNEIWRVGARTVHLNIQEYVWDGIKRDRLVWMGDLFPEAKIIAGIFGQAKEVERSMDFLRDRTPPTNWINGISTYSLWWILVHKEWYLQFGDKSYLALQGDYMAALIDTLESKIDAKGEENCGNILLDHPTCRNVAAGHAGQQGALLLALEAAAYLFDELGKKQLKQRCLGLAQRVGNVVPDPGQSKPAAAFQVLAGMRDAAKANGDILANDPFSDFSPFFGYFVLQARAMAGDIGGCLDTIRTFWGAMIDLGATTFWEGFELSWKENASRIDELPIPGKRDVHADCGDFCYKGLRNSFCHGWSAGPTAWLTEHILGFRPLAAGCSKLAIKPNLGDLEWAAGAYPTPLGDVVVDHRKQADGSIKSRIDAPGGIEIVKR